MKKIFLALSITLMLVGCASTGNKQVKNRDYTSQVASTGKTQDEVMEALGEPTNVQFRENGQEVWTYTYTNSDTRVTTFIPVIGLFLGGADMEVTTLNILFTENGTVAKTITGSTKGGAGSIFD